MSSCIQEFTDLMIQSTTQNFLTFTFTVLSPTVILLFSGSFNSSTWERNSADSMYKNCFGKLLVQASATSSQRKRLQQVKTATEKTARMLDMDYEVINSRTTRSPIYVYYESGDEEPIPIYCDEGKEFESKEICTTLKNMMYVLSFHPSNLVLKRARSSIMRLS